MEAHVIRAYRVSVAISSAGWMVSWLSVAPLVWRASAIGWTGIGFPWLLASPWLALVPLLVTPLAGLLVALWPSRRRIRAQAWLWLACTLFLAAHELTLGNAGFHGGIWVALWHVWVAEALWKNPSRAVAHGPLLAVLIGSALFLPAATGKLGSGYLDGTTFAALAAGNGRFLPAQLLGIDARSYPLLGRLYSDMALAAEFSLAFGALLPVRIALAWLVCVTLAMTLTWSVWLLPITGQIFGLAVGALLLERAARLPACGVLR